MLSVRHRLISAGAAALAVILLAACGASGNSGASNGASGSGSSSSAGSGTGSGDLKAAVQKSMQPVDKLPIPTEKVDVSGFSGKTVYFIPLLQSTRAFQITGEALKEALGKAGMNLQTCDGGANPSSISGCVNQAIGASAAAIVTDSIPYGMAANAFDAARAKNIPVLNTDQIADDQHPADKTLAYLTGPGTQMQVQAADWIIADSGGNAGVVLERSTDNPSTQAYVAGAVKEFKDKCPGCKTSTYDITASNYPLVAPSTSSAILSRPDAKYLMVAFDAFLQPTLGGVQQSGKAGTLSVTSTAALLSGLQSVKSGQLKAEVGQDLAFQGWCEADAVFRLLAGQSVPEYDIPTRLFTSANLGSIDLTADAEASGAWFGPTDFPKEFAAVWGLS